MAKVVKRIKEFVILKDRRGYVVVNTRGSYDNHSHVKTEKTAELLINLINNRVVPNSPYLIESARRVTLDESYRISLETKQNRLQNKPKYININKGVMKK